MAMMPSSGVKTDYLRYDDWIACGQAGNGGSNSRCSDIEAIRRDWQQVGDDMRAAISSFEREHHESGQ